MSVIIGINAFHPDSSACIVIDGELKACVAEERLGKRVKHSSDFPVNAIRAVLKEVSLDLKDVTHIAIARDPRANMAGKIKQTLTHPIPAMAAVWEYVKRNRKVKGVPEMIADACGVSPDSVRHQYVSVEHHLAHIASAYFVSPFESLTAGLSYDASGDFASTMAARCEGNRVVPIAKVLLPHSLGRFYTAVCQFIGFGEFGEEYKVMGLSSYGQDAYAEQMKELVHLIKDGWYKLNAPYFGSISGGESGRTDAQGKIFMGQLYTQKMIDLLGQPKPRSAPITDREKNIAKSCQVRFEEAAIHCMNNLQKLVGTEQFVMAGGCALNGVANARILRETPFKKYYLQCASSDEGTSLGAAYYCYHHVLGQTKRFHMNHAFWGPLHSHSEMQVAAEGAKCPMQEYDDKTLLDVVAQLLKDGKVVGWYQGRSEWGPRALGNRSILANPSLPTIKDTINLKIKRRESFRPFAPTILKEHVSEVFEQDVDSPFMMHVVKIRPQWRAKLPGVCHVDDTGRLQSLSRENNARYYDLVTRFHQLTGIPLVLNTSFNENEPVVDTPQQAVDCFLRTDMDVLCLGNIVMKKPGV